MSARASSRQASNGKPICGSSGGRTRLRCAVYTRKSTEDGLDQAFNSLDAQREACEAYIASQASLGWKLLPDRYDDGGISGGSMQRPALQQLLSDIRDGRVDIVVVYKIDRLTRSLMDFARMVEIFDQAEVSFVSVTQQFNTTTSMGRLTLNVLLSFAQFEREVTAERIRDKIAASKRKGMWMGGTVPFGYLVQDRKLVVEPKAAAEVGRLFDRYLALGSVPALAAELNEQRVSTASPSLLLRDTGQGRRKAAVRIGTGKLYYMLSNPIYVGRVRHGEALHKGEHAAIVSASVFDAVQSRLASQAPRPRGSAIQRDIHLLTGLIFDETGDRLSPIHANKAGKRYRYYVSSSVLKQNQRKKQHQKSVDQPAPTDGLRLPAAEIEAVVLAGLHGLMCDHPRLAGWIEAAGWGDRTEAALQNARTQADRLNARASPDGLRDLLRSVLNRVEVAGSHVRLRIDRGRVVSMLTGSGVTDRQVPDRSAMRGGIMTLGGVIADDADVESDTIEAGAIPRPVANARSISTAVAGSSGIDDDLHVIDIPMKSCRRGIARRLVIDGHLEVSPPRPDRPLIDAIAKAHAYRDALCDGRGHGRREIAERFNVHAEDVSRLLPLAFLSPAIVEAILTGRQPADLSVQMLTRRIDLPVSWTAQAKLLGF